MTFLIGNLLGARNHDALASALDRSQAIVRFKPDGTITDANENFLSAVGYRREEIAGKHHSRLVPDQIARSDSYKSFWRDLAQGEFKSGLFKRVARDGSEVWLQASYNPVLKGGAVREVVKIASDVTRETLASSDRSGQVDAINRSQAVVHFDLEGHVRWANDLFLDSVGYRLRELEGQHHRTLVPRDIARSDEYRTFWRDLARGDIKSGEFRRVAKDGSERWLSASYNPIFDPEGEVVKVVKYALDVTEAVQQRERRKEVSAKVDGNLTNISESIDEIDSKAKDAAEVAGKTLETVQSVASAAEQFETSAESISQSTSDSKTQAENAKSEAESANAKIDELSAASDDMTEAVKLIRGIADQINMLALNATIEAARAGEAGKGFAVVAQEVKQLANQSTDATNKIAGQIERTQTTAKDVVNSLQAITQAVETVESSISTVAGAIEQQTASSREMASNVSEASSTVEDVKGKLDDISDSVAEVSRLARAGAEEYRKLQE